VPLVALLSGANRHDSSIFDQRLDAVPSIRQLNRRRRKRPEKLHADKAYDIPRCRQALRRRHIRIRIARKGRDSSERLGPSPLGGRAHAGLAESLPSIDGPRRTPRRPPSGLPDPWLCADLLQGLLMTGFDRRS